MIQLVLKPLGGSPVQKMSVFFRPTIQPLLVTVSSAPIGFQYPFGAILVCAAWLKKYHWFPACSAVPWRINCYKYTMFTMKVEKWMRMQTIQFPRAVVLQKNRWDDVRAAWEVGRFCDGGNGRQDLHLRGRSGSLEVG